MSRTILTIIELDNYPEDVVARAAWLAEMHDAKLELLLSEPTSGFFADTFILSEEVRRIAEDIEQAEDTILEQLAKTAHDRSIETKVSKSPVRGLTDVVVDKAGKLEPLFVVKGTHYHTPAERATFADTDWQMIRRLACPLWFVKPGTWQPKPLIVAAVDPAHSGDKPAKLDQRIVQSAVDLAARCGGKAEIIHTYQRLTEIGAHAMKTFKPMKLPVDKLDERIREDHRQKLEAFAEDNGIPGKSLHLLPGRTHEILPSFARTHGASLVVMGAISRAGLKRRIIGNTAERTLDHVPCDVLVVHPD